MTENYKLERTAGKYIGDLVYGANDGIITTFAVVAGVTGGRLLPHIVIILGISNLIADGFSMAASNYLARKSEKEYATNISDIRIESRVQRPWRNALATFLSFVIAGSVPLLPFILKVEDNAFWWATLSTSFALFIVGSLRTLVTRKLWWRSGLEMLFVGALAAMAAYFIGSFIGSLI
jgi:vacuolar iron transporter family protein